MKQAQIQMLHQTGAELLAKARAVPDLKQAQGFTDLGLKCLAEAREILEANRRNHLLFFVELSFASGFEPTHKAFLLFCERNSFDPISQEDFDIFLSNFS